MADARVDWAAPPIAVDRLIRSVTPEPGAWTTFRGERLGLGPVRTGGAGRARAEAGASCTSRSAGCWSARPPRRSSWARCGRSASGRCRRRTGPAACASSPAELLAMTVPRRESPPATAAPAGRRDGGARPAPPRGRAGPARPPELDPARQAALELLTAVRTRDAYANLALPAILRRHRLRDRDAGLATELGYGTLRARGLLDAVIEACTDRPLVPGGAAAAGRPAAGRLPAAAHPGPAARRGRHHGGAGAGRGGQPGGRVRQRHPAQGRRAGRAGLGAAAAPPADADDPIGHAAFAHAHPRWIAQAFADALGRRRAGRAGRRAGRRRRPARPCTCSAGPGRSPRPSWPW